MTNQVRFNSERVFGLRHQSASTHDRVNIFGINFPAENPGQVSVTVNGVAATVLFVATRVVTFEVPAGASTGDVIITINGNATNLGTLQVQGVSVTPGLIEVDYGLTQQFTANVSGATDPTVIWKVNGLTGGSASVGTIDAAGLYTAPLRAAAAEYPFLVEAFNAELGTSGYASVRLPCGGTAPLPKDVFTAGSFAAPAERDCFEFTGFALEDCYLVYLGDVPAYSLRLRDSDGVVIAAAQGPSPQLVLSDVTLGRDDLYRVEVEGDTTPGNYQLWRSDSSSTPLGTWVYPGDGNWNDPANWAMGVVPTSSTDVIIPDFPGTLTVTVAANAVAASVQSAEALRLVGGELKVSGNLQVDAPLTLEGGVLVDATVLPSLFLEDMQAFNQASNALRNVKLQRHLAVPPSGQVTFQGGVDVFGEVRLDEGSRLWTKGSQTWTQGTFVFESTSNEARIENLAGFAGTVTLRPGVTIQGGRGTIDNTTVVNEGLIEANQAGLRIAVDALNFTNETAGTVRAVSGGQVWLETPSTFEGQHTVSNKGAMEVDQGTLVLGGHVFNDHRNPFRYTGSWTNTGTIQGTGGAIYLRGQFSVDELAGISGDSALILQGWCDNTGNALVLDGSRGQWILEGGRFIGGSLAFAGGFMLDFTGNGLFGFESRLSDITLLSSLTMEASDILNLDNVTLDPAQEIVLQGSASLRAWGDETWSSGAIRFDGGGVIQSNTNGSLTLASGGTIRGGGGSIQIANFLNDSGLVSADVSGQSIELRSAFTNAASGTMEALNGGALVLGDPGINTVTTWSNQGTISGDSSAVLFYDNWSNPGSIAMSQCVLQLIGNGSLSQLGSMTNPGGDVTVIGNFDLEAGTLNLDGTNGSWGLLTVFFGSQRSQATLENGTVNLSNGEVLTLEANSYGPADTFLKNLTVNGDVVPRATETVRFTVENLTLTGTLVMEGANHLLFFDGNQTFPSGTIALTGSTSSFNRSIQMKTGNTLTLGPAATLRITSGTVHSMTLINQGTIETVADGLSIEGQFNGVTLSNQGTVHAGSGTTMRLQSGSSLTQTAGGTQTDGTLILENGGGTLDLQGGTWSGLGSLIANLTVTGSVTPGTMSQETATLGLSGAYAHATDAGSLDLQLAGTAAGSFDQVSVGGSAGFDGTLNVTLSGGFQPQLGDVFDIVLYGSHTGSQFDTLNLPTLGGGLQWQVEYLADRLRLTVI